MIEQSWNVDLGGTDDEICARIVEILAEMESLGVFDKPAREARGLVRLDEPKSGSEGKR